jgi:hypothetical protein
MKYFVLLLVIVLWWSCSKDADKTYPISYTLDHIEQSDEALYLVESSTGLSDLPANLGSYGANREEIKQEIRDFFTIAFDLREVVLLSEDSLRIHFFIDNEEFDTTLNYTMIGDSINIDSLQGGLLTYNKDADEFIICGVTSFALAGPNVANPGHEYYQLNTIECTPGFSNRDYAIELLNGFDYAELDTLGVLLTKYVYK